MAGRQYTFRVTFSLIGNDQINGESPNFFSYVEDNDVLTKVMQLINNELVSFNWPSFASYPTSPPVLAGVVDTSFDEFSPPVDF